MKKIYVLTIFLLLGSISCQNHQVKERERIKAFAETFFTRVIDGNNGTIAKSQFWEESQSPNTYSIIIRFPRENALEDIKKIVSEFYRGQPPWSVGCDWIFDVDRYVCFLYDTSSDIAVTYGYHPAHPTQLAILINSYSAVNEQANKQ